MSEVHVDRNCTKHGGLNQYCSLCLAECAEKVAIAARVPVGDEARQLAAELARKLHDLASVTDHGPRYMEAKKLLTDPRVQALLGTESPKSVICKRCGHELNIHEIEQPCTCNACGLGPDDWCDCAGFSYERSVEARPSPSPWIPVSERLPEDDRMVLIAHSYDLAGVSRWLRWPNPHWRGYVNFEVTHWRELGPLPAPPEPQPKEGK